MDGGVYQTDERFLFVARTSCPSGKIFILFDDYRQSQMLLVRPKIFIRMQQRKILKDAECGYNIVNRFSNGYANSA